MTYLSTYDIRLLLSWIGWDTAGIGVNDFFSSFFLGCGYLIAVIYGVFLFLVAGYYRSDRHLDGRKVLHLELELDLTSIHPNNDSPKLPTEH